RTWERGATFRRIRRSKPTSIPHPLTRRKWLVQSHFRRVSRLPGPRPHPEDTTLADVNAPIDPPALPPAADGDGMPAPIPSLDIETELRDSYLTYAMSVIVSRALPDVRDGLKPVQR